MKRQIVNNRQEFIDWVNLYNGKMNCYTTVYDFLQYSESSKVDGSIVLDRMFLDFDAHDEPLENALKDVLRITKTLLRDDIKFKMYFSGKGFHVIVYGEIANDIRSIQQRFTELAKDCPTLDRTGIQTNRLRRIPNTANLSSDYFCIPICSADVYEGLDGILLRAKQMRQGTFNYGQKLQTWKELKSIEMSDIEIAPPKPAGKLPILPCLHNAIMVENPSHYARVYLTQWYRDLLSMRERNLSNENNKEILETIMKEFEFIKDNEDVWLDWDESVTRKYTKGIIDGGYHAPGCKSVLIPQGYCVGKCWRYCE
jgi:hypothetical protein